MNKVKCRREFLKQSVTMGTSLAIGGIGLAGCCKHLCSKKESTAEDEIDYSRYAYCCINCNECSLYKATIKNDEAARMEVAKEWDAVKRPNFKLEDFYCYGCKDDRSLGAVVKGCAVRKCVVKKGFATCAQCSDFEACDKKLWQDFPQIRDSVRKMKARLGIS